jgi:decaprenylphospho-beta-D-erythro-pentofuranosid-2-ulose 2-reductase
MAERAEPERAGALVIGASSGTGAALGRELVRRGYRVALVARRRAELEALAASLNQGAAAPVAFAYAHDVTAYHEAPMLFNQIATEVAPLRLIVYTAGVMTRAPMGSNFAGEHAMLETNVVGAMRWLSLGADHLKRTGGGTLVGVSSVAGERGRPGNGAYMASKAALTSYLDSLGYKVHGTGVRVVTIKPGYVASPMTAGLKLPARLTVTPEVAARRIASAAVRGRREVYVPGIWRPIMWLVRHLPSAVVARMPG